MNNAWAMFGGVAGAMVLALLSGPVQAADRHAAEQAGMTNVAAEELDRRSRQAPSSQGGGLSESSVRVMVTYAFSLIPEKVKDANGVMVAVDKSDPNKFVIPLEDARRVIRAATRSAYADVCGIPELGKANYKTMLAQEEAKQNWNREQLLMIEALHLFAVSYFTGNAKFTGGGDSAPADGAQAAPSDAGVPQEVQAPAPPACPPEQRQKVESAINAYVAAAGAN